MGMSDWSEDGCSSELKLVEKELDAKLISNGLTDEGRNAICQNANGPGSDDSCRYILFDLEQGDEIARWEVETGWADGYEFDTTGRHVYLLRNNGGRVGYDFDGAMLDRKGWQTERIGAGDLYVIRSEEHTSELQSLLRISYAVFCLKKKKKENKKKLHIKKRTTNHTNKLRHHYI